MGEGAPNLGGPARGGVASWRGREGARAGDSEQGGSRVEGTGTRFPRAERSYDLGRGCVQL